MSYYGAQFQKNKKTIAKLNFEKYGEYTCEICKKSPLFPGIGTNADRLAQYNGVLLTVDHIKSLKNGGKHGLYNLQVCCNECNSKKGCK